MNNTGAVYWSACNSFVCLLLKMASNGPEKKVGAAKIVSSTVKSDENSADDVNYQDLTQFVSSQLKMYLPLMCEYI